MKTIEEAAVAYIQARLEQKLLDRKWRTEIVGCDGEPKCLFMPDASRGDLCEVCASASLGREQARAANRRKHSRLETLEGAVARSGALRKVVA